jgi:hypothetical protein
MRVSTSPGVRCSRVRRSAFFGRFGDTVRFTSVGVTSLRRGNIDAVRAAAHTDPTSPTGAAIRDWNAALGLTQKTIAIDQDHGAGGSRAVRSSVFTFLGEDRAARRRDFGGGGYPESRRTCAGGTLTMTPAERPRGIDVIGLMWRKALRHCTVGRGPRRSMIATRPWRPTSPTGHIPMLQTGSLPSAGAVAYPSFPT